jgi:hypothetical protein
MGDWHEGHASEWGPPPIVKKVIAPQLGQRTRPKPPGVFSPGMSTLTLPTPIAGHSILGPSGNNNFEPPQAPCRTVGEEQTPAVTFRPPAALFVRVVPPGPPCSGTP